MTPLELHRKDCTSCRWAAQGRGVSCSVGRRLLRQEDAARHASEIVASIHNVAVVTGVVADLMQADIEAKDLADAEFDSQIPRRFR